MEIYLIRHSQVAVAPGLCYGRSDVALADSYRDDWKKLYAKLPAASRVNRIFSSPLSRCQLFAKSLQCCGLRTDSRLTELNFGHWELRPWDAVERREFDVWSADIVNQRCPGGESYQDLFQRVCAFWAECAADRAKDDTVFVVTHSGIIRALLALILEMPLEKSLRLAIDFGGVTKVNFLQDVPIVAYINR